MQKASSACVASARTRLRFTPSELCALPAALPSCMRNAASGRDGTRLTRPRGACAAHSTSTPTKAQAPRTTSPSDPLSSCGHSMRSWNVTRFAETGSDDRHVCSPDANARARPVRARGHPRSRTSRTPCAKGHAHAHRWSPGTLCAHGGLKKVEMERVGSRMGTHRARTARARTGSNISLVVTPVQVCAFHASFG